MKYFSGFCFKNESELFTKFLPKTNYCIAGFSKGAIKALEFTYNNPNQRIDRLILLSPAYFNDKDKKFIRTQLMYFKKETQTYIDNFVANTLYPSNMDMKDYICDGTYDELEFLLTYRWDIQKMKSIIKNGTIIEVYLGDNDKIIDSQATKEIFQEFSTIYTIKGKGHILC